MYHQNCALYLQIRAGYLMLAPSEGPCMGGPICLLFFFFEKNSAVFHVKHEVCTKFNTHDVYVQKSQSQLKIVHYISL